MQIHGKGLSKGSWEKYKVLYKPDDECITMMYWTLDRISQLKLITKKTYKRTGITYYSNKRGSNWVKKIICYDEIKKNINSQLLKQIEQYSSKKKKSKITTY